ncbi:MAG: RluA family pseudouridine synthase [Spirosomaceae bacterium]|jgi:23S rRNA pseudouridine1911/1915/1917 synthase|nr:RluA family pseudouridine synthase [Spirosomataceae bacterium]
MIKKRKHNRKIEDKAPINLKVTEEAELMAFLIEKLSNKNRNNVKSLLRNRQVAVNGMLVSQFNHPLKPNDDIEIRWNRGLDSSHYRGLQIIFEDEHLIVINKSEGLLSISTDNKDQRNAYGILREHVKVQSSMNKIFIVHRLDRETSGIMMFAKSEEVQSLLQDWWHSTAKERFYLALVEGEVKQQTGTITSYLAENAAFVVYSTKNPKDGQKAVTNYEVLKSNRNFSLLKVKLDTGRKNQIRVHCQDIGHPIVGDKKYGANYNPIGRVGLHAWVLGFEHPITGEYLRFETPIPRKFSEVF